MPKYLVLPKIGMNMEEAVISEWLIKPGDKVEKEQMVVRAETDKAVQELFATDSGIVYKLLVEPGDVVACQEKIAMLLDEGEEYNGEVDEKKERDSSDFTEIRVNKEAQRERSVFSVISKNGKKQRISPLARKLAKELNISEDNLYPAEPGKRIVKADVFKCKAEMDSCAQREEEANVFVPFTRTRQFIAKKMMDSVSHKPRVSLVTTVDCEKLIEVREKLKKYAKTGYNEIIAKACGMALRKYPEMNCITEENGYRIMKTVNIGVAVDTSEGLLVPVLKNVESKGILKLTKEFGELVEKARNGALSIDEMSGGTFSISNVGMFGVESFDPIINSPECLILGVGCMKECVSVVRHEMCIRTCMKLSLSFDHAVFDGAAAARLLKEIKDLLEDPVMMLA